MKERIEDYEATHGVNFPIKKLLILQPKSFYTPNKLNSDLLEDVRVSGQFAPTIIAYTLIPSGRFIPKIDLGPKKIC